jgi:uncharacterized membrane protein
VNLWRTLLAFFFIGAGVSHFLSPNSYLAIMPRYLPWPAALVAISGAAEIAGGLGVLFPVSRRLAAWGLIALLIFVFPANIQAISTGLVIAGRAVPGWILWLRLPLQLVFVVWVSSACLVRSSSFVR